METPPQFSPSGGPPKKSNTVLIVVLVVLGVCALCCVGVIFAGIGAFNKIKGSIGCLTHYELTRKALSDYANDHDGKLPPAKTWQDAIIPYYGKGKSGDKASAGGMLDFGDASKDLGCAAEGSSPATGMAFNAQLAEMTVTKAKETPSTVLIFEVPQTGRNIAMPYKAQAGQSPLKFVGQSRDWITVPVSGAMNVNPNRNDAESRGVNGL